MNSSVVKKTQDSLGKIIGKKPPLTEKLLNRPPFRFLHDVLTSVTRVTGFMKGLYTDAEASSETISSKDEKIAYLQKAIDIVAHVTGDKLSVRPSKIVAGLEAEKTNEFLQSLAAACNAQPDNDSAVKAVLGGEKPSNKDSRSDRGPSADKRKNREKSDSSEKIVEKSEDKENREKDEKRDRGDRDRRQRDSSRDGKRESSRHRDRGESSKGERGERHKDRESSRNREDKERDKSRDKSASGRDREGRKDRDEKKDRSSRRRKEEEKSSASLNNGEADNDKKEDGTAGVEGHGEEEPTTNRIPRPSSAKGSRRRHREGRRGVDDGDDDDEDQKEVEPQAEPTQQKRLLRPASARPAPPKVKRTDGGQDSLHDRIDSGTRRVENVIVDQANHSEDDDDNFTVEENNITADPINTDPEPVNMSTTEDGEHGGLVKKILESKKEFDNTQSQQTKTKIEKSSMNDATRHKEREMVKKEVDKLRSSIQTLTRSANPLGKVMDYVQEDLHSMQKERDSWKQENRKLQGDIERELKVTDGSIEPLKTILSQLEQAVSDQLDLIAAAKHKIIDNDEKISKMLSSISQG